MKIVISSYSFWPRLGGIERVGVILARGLAERGHRVKVLTQTPLPKGVAELEYHGVQVLRTPTLGQAFRAFLWSDVHLQNNISVKPLLIAMSTGRNSVVVYHTWIDSRAHGDRRTHRLKALVGNMAFKQLAVSQALASSIGQRCGVIENPYDNRLFSLSNRNFPNSVLFVGRITADKGLDILIQAMAKVRAEGQDMNLVVVGNGDALGAIKDLVSTLGLGSFVDFKGALTPEETAAEMSRSAILAVPSVWQEPFGLVAIEGLASGCRVLASDTGGLPEALGGFGRIVKAGSVEDWSLALTAALKDRASFTPTSTDLKDLEIHLDKYRLQNVVSQYEHHLLEAAKIGGDFSGKGAYP